MKKKIIFLLATAMMLISLILVKPVDASCCGGRGCDPNNLPPVHCSGTYGEYHCSTQEECGDPVGTTSSKTDVTCGAGNEGINTAIGCITGVLSDAGPEAFLGQLLKWAVGVGGGIAFILIVYAGFMIMTAAGNPERLKAGQELLTSAISGLILLIFSIFMLRFIGIDILKLDLFGFGK